MRGLSRRKNLWRPPFDEASSGSDRGNSRFCQFRRYAEALPSRQARQKPSGGSAHALTFISHNLLVKLSAARSRLDARNNRLIQSYKLRMGPASMNFEQREFREQLSDQGLILPDSLDNATAFFYAVNQLIRSTPFEISETPASKKPVFASWLFDRLGTCIRYFVVAVVGWIHRV